MNMEMVGLFLAKFYIIVLIGSTVVLFYIFVVVNISMNVKLSSV